MRRLIAAAATVLLLASASVSIASAQATTAGSAQIKYRINPMVRAQVIPNYLAGFGPIGGLGSGSSPAAGAGADEFDDTHVLT